jgi:hypothetical protein
VAAQVWGWNNQPVETAASKRERLAAAVVAKAAESAERKAQRAAAKADAARRATMVPGRVILRRADGTEKRAAVAPTPAPECFAGSRWEEAAEPLNAANIAPGTKNGAAPFERSSDAARVYMAAPRGLMSRRGQGKNERARRTTTAHAATMDAAAVLG